MSMKTKKLIGSARKLVRAYFFALLRDSHQVRGNSIVLSVVGQNNLGGVL